MAMDENRLVDLILLVILVLGTAGLAGFYYAMSDHHFEEQPSLLTRMSTPPPNNINGSSSRLSFKVNEPGDSHSLSVGQSKNEPTGTTDRSDAIKFAVVPEGTYYIKLDLRNAPIETPQYHLHITFN